ncbi:MAG: Lrp/AsnC family transcriptional regulator [Nitrospinota bacterium]
MDHIDRQILELLQQDGRRTNLDIAQTVGLSAPSVSERIKKLTLGGYIKRYVALLDPKRVRRDTTAFISVMLSRPRYAEGFIESIMEIADVLECHHITGEYSYLLKIRTGDTDSLGELISERIRAIEGVTGTRTNVVLGTVKEETALDLSAIGAEAPTSEGARRRRESPGVTARPPGGDSDA